MEAGSTDNRGGPDRDAEIGGAASSAGSPGTDPAGREQALQHALELAYAQLNRRERTVAEVRAQLQRKGVSHDRAEEAVETLIEQRLLDDERFAQLFVADKRALEQWGSERIRRGLSARGIDPELAEHAIIATPDAGDDDRRDGELQRALELLRHRFPDPPRERRERNRALGVLLRKGYQQELAIDALNAHARGA